MSSVTPKTWILFDLDNTLIDTENLAFEAAAPVANRILASKGITETYTTTKLVAYWFGCTFKHMLTELGQKHGFTVTDEERALWKQWEEDAIIAAVKKSGKPCVGVMPVLDKLVKDGKYNLAIVSSSSLPRMLGCLDAVDMRKYFEDRYIFSATTSLPVPTPKPNPAVYKFALETLKITANEAVAVEDSLGGVDAARGAELDVIGYVGCLNQPMHQGQIEVDMGHRGAAGVMRQWSEFFGLLAALESKNSA